jgi:hypothetical protein
MTDDTIGTIEGIATFNWVEINTDKHQSVVRVHGYYEGSTTTYETDRERVRVGGMTIQMTFDSMKLEPTEGNYLYVEATEDELRITEDKPNDLPDVTPREIVQLMAAQSVVMDHHEQLDEEYKENIRRLAEEYGIDHELLDQ